MEVTIIEISPTKKNLRIKVPQGEISSYEKNALQKVGSTAKVKGFRPGKIPTSMLQKMFGGQIAYETLNLLIENTFSKALSEHALDPIAKPQFETLPLSDGDYEYTVTVEVRPKVKLQNYKGISLSKKEIKISEEDISNELKKLQENLAQLTAANEGSTAQAGLVVTLDFEGKLNGVPFDGGKAADYVVELGKGQLLPEFEEKISGMKVKEQKVIEVTFPGDYFQKDLAGRTSTFDITIKNLHQKTLPALDDDLARDIGKENLEQVRSEIESALKQRKEKDMRREYASEIIKNLQSQYTFEVPESLVTQELESRSTQEGLDRKQIENALRVEYVLQEIASTEKLTPENADIERELRMIAQITRKTTAELRKMVADPHFMSHIMNRILRDKALDFMIDNAKLS